MEKINIAELLRNCPEGMELDCTICNNVVTLKGVDKEGHFPINVVTKSGFRHILTCEGYVYDDGDAKCVIFPKGKTTWEGFIPPCQFKDGDVLISAHGKPFILKKIHDNKICESYCGIRQNGEFVIESHNWTSNYNLRLATEKEKKKLFDVIKDNGYTWNEETKTLKKLPKFKVGDRIILKDNPFNMPSIKITAVTKSQYILENEGFFYISSADEKYVLEDKFDITTLKPFDKVLVRDDNDENWAINWYGYYNKEDNTFRCIGNCDIGWEQCIPYEGNEHLLGTTDDCDEYFKIWE